MPQDHLVKRGVREGRRREMRTTQSLEKGIPTLSTNCIYAVSRYVAWGFLAEARSEQGVPSNTPDTTGKSLPRNDLAPPVQFVGGRGNGSYVRETGLKMCLRRRKRFMGGHLLLVTPSRSASGATIPS